MLASLLLLFARAQRLPATISVNVDGVTRSALVYPASSATQKRSPLVFVFHGHYGTARLADRAYHLEDSWPEATVVYPQGLPNMSKVVGYGNGWQTDFGGDEDRDLKFVDALASKLEADYRLDSGRIYACGMSNGAVFSLLLVAARPDTFRAFASVAGVGGNYLRKLKARKPVLMINGSADRLVPLNLAEETRDYLIRFNGCARTPDSMNGYEIYSGPSGADVAWHEHDGRHEWPSFATAEVVRFFQAH